MRGGEAGEGRKERGEGGGGKGTGGGLRFLTDQLVLNSQGETNGENVSQCEKLDSSRSYQNPILVFNISGTDRRKFHLSKNLTGFAVSAGFPSDSFMRAAPYIEYCNKALIE